MKTIQPVSVWYNGQEKQATILACYANTDNLKDSASFFYQLICLKEESIAVMPENNIVLASGTLSMSGDDYDNWQTNEYAYNWVASKLNITIIGEYVQPAPQENTYVREVISEVSTETSEPTEQTEG